MAYKRRKPYTARGIRRVPCRRCGKPSRFQWQVCADDRVFRGICARCDVKLNVMVLRWIGRPGWRQQAAHYKRKVNP